MAEIEFVNITRKFGSFTANDVISLTIKNNTVHCILGENGAGKSTLVKILFGMYKPDSGLIKIDGKEVMFNSPHDAIDHGIGIVHQHFMLIDDFTVLENVILGSEMVTGLSSGKSNPLHFIGKLNIKESGNVISSLIEKYNLNLPLNKKAGDISIGDQQKVEILKLLYRKSEILIFDEPTAVLSPVEVEDFFAIINEFKQKGKTIILITHKLAEVQKIADAVSVLRRGKLVYSTESNVNGKDKFNTDELSRAIIGNMDLQGMTDAKEKPEIPPVSKSVLRLKDVRLTRNGVKALNGLDLDIRKGEIHGICGVEGNGQSEIVEVIAGLEKDYSGERTAGNIKISLVPDDRIKKGFIREFNIGENIFIKNSRKKFITDKELTRNARNIISEYDVRVSAEDLPLGSLSGGNQQKVVVAREIEYDGDVLIFFHPTRGVDLNATLFIHSKIIEQRNKGKAILLISSDIDELIALSDRLSVVYKGRITGTFLKSEFSGESGGREEMPASELLERESDKSIFNRIGKLMIGLEA